MTQRLQEVGMNLSIRLTSYTGNESKPNANHGEQQNSNAISPQFVTED
jgi:hypothetical protein